MKRFTGWTTAFAATALLAGPVAVSAQQTSPAPTAAQPTTPEPTASAATAPQSAPTPAQAEPAAQPAPAPQAQADPDTVKRHLTAARDSLSQITQLPAAAQLTGDARTQVSQLIANFNELITTTTEWRASYAKVQANLAALVGDQAADESPATPASGTPGAVGTSGSVAIDPTIKAKLIEFRTHLLAFEKAAGGAAATSLSASQSQSAATNAPSAAATTSPSEPAAAAATTSTAPTAGSTAAPQAAAGTTGTTSNAPAAAASASTTTATEPEQSRPSTAAPQSAAGTASQQSGHAEAMRHIEAIDAILNGRTAGSATAGATGTMATVTTLDRDKIEQIKTHLAELRRALAQSGGR